MAEWCLEHRASGPQPSALPLTSLGWGLVAGRSGRSPGHLPLPAVAPYLGVLAALVQGRQCQECFRRDVLVEDSEDERRQGGEEEIEEYHLPVIDHGGAREAAEELVPEEQVDVALRAESVAV